MPTTCCVCWGTDSASEFGSSVSLYTALYMPSMRTQIYLSAEQRRLLDARGRAIGAPLAKMIRDAVDAYLIDESPDLGDALDQTFGSLPELETTSRGEWETGADPHR
jgi:hypothetical protein